MAKRKGIGNRFAPMRFLLFFVMLVIGVGASLLVTPWWLGVMYGFDLAALVFVLSCINLFRHKEKEMRLAAEDSRPALLKIIYSNHVGQNIRRVAEKLGATHFFEN